MHELNKTIRGTLLCFSILAIGAIAYYAGPLLVDCSLREHTLKAIIRDFPSFLVFSALLPSVYLLRLEFAVRMSRYKIVSGEYGAVFFHLGPNPQGSESPALDYIIVLIWVCVLSFGISRLQFVMPLLSLVICQYVSFVLLLQVFDRYRIVGSGGDYYIRRRVGNSHVTMDESQRSGINVHVKNYGIAGFYGYGNEPEVLG